MKAYIDRIIAELEDRLAAAKREPPGLARDCRVADLETRLAAAQRLSGVINQIDRLEGQFGGEVPLASELEDWFFAAVEELRKRPKPH
jgi:hypothetical protein